jgi:hypothetical protein
MIFEIISKNPLTEEGLRKLVAHNEKDFVKAGFITQYEKVSDGVYHLIFTFGNPMAKAGMTNPLGVRLMIHSMKKQFKNFDKYIQITKIKEKEVK